MTSGQDTERRLTALEERIQDLSDQLEIMRLISSYGPQADSARNPEEGRGPASLWTRDGVYDLGEFGVSRGRDEIAARFGAPAHLFCYERGSAHVMGLPHIRIEGDRASAFSYSRVYLGQGDQSFFVQRVSANLWEFVRVDGAWKVMRRTNRLVNNPRSKELARQVGSGGLMTAGEI